MLTQPVALFLTVSIPLYVAAGAAPGTANGIEPAKATFVTLTKPFDNAVASYTILYWSGLPEMEL